MNTAADWCKIKDVTILDPDGWRYKGGADDFFTKPIPETEFEEKISQCTTRPGFRQSSIDVFRSHWQASKATSGS